MGGVRRAKKRSNRSKPKKKFQAKNLEKRITKLEHTEELKYIDYYSIATWVGGPIIFFLNNIGQGDDFNQRVGEEVTAKYLNLMYRFTAPAGTNSNDVRIIVGWDMQTNGVGPTALKSTNAVEGLLDDDTITQALLSPHNNRNKDRYHVLYDKTYTFHRQESTVVETYVVRKSFKLGGAKIKYASSGSTIAALTSRSLFVAGFVNSTSNLTFQIGHRFWFTDS
ncbi:capsid [uncultured virus]|uniref:Capsid n=1 Tax=uncultured virus TaxID=340016 RepID=A0A2K9LUT8_9VIRU|nr:capsid [uncultured virus]